MISMLILIIESIYINREYHKMKRENDRLKFLLYTPSDAIQRGQENRPFPNISLIDFKSDKKIRLFDLPIKDKLLVFVFSTDCYTCDRVSEIWNQIYASQNQSCTIMGISKNDPAAIEGYVARNHILFPVFQYQSFTDFEFFGMLPRSLAIDKNGIVTSTLSGLIPDMETLLLK